MARPTKWRKIENTPVASYFVPTDIELSEVAENVLKLEELEALRLKDLECLEQEECAERMEVSRPTFQRILLSARRKIADSLVNVKAIHIEGGKYTQNICRIRCCDCGNQWVESYEKLDSTVEYSCPGCGSKRISCEQSCKESPFRGSCWRQSQDE